MRRADRLRIEAERRELERARQWLRYFVVYTRGKAAALSALALNSDIWPPRSVRQGAPRKKP